MSSKGKTRGNGTGKCKARRRRPRPADAPPGGGAGVESAPQYTAPWAERFFDVAFRGYDVAHACKVADVTLRDVHRQRERDALFDASWLELDSLLRLAAVESVRSLAAGGNLKAIKALTDGSLTSLGYATGETPDQGGGGRGGPSLEAERCDVECPGCRCRLRLYVAARHGLPVCDRVEELERDGRGEWEPLRANAGGNQALIDDAARSDGRPLTRELFVAASEPRVGAHGTWSVEEVS